MNKLAATVALLLAACGGAPDSGILGPPLKVHHEAGPTPLQDAPSAPEGGDAGGPSRDAPTGPGDAAGGDSGTPPGDAGGDDVASPADAGSDADAASADADPDAGTTGSDAGWCSPPQPCLTNDDCNTSLCSVCCSGVCQHGSTCT